jgi:hypothetical protein
VQERQLYDPPVTTDELERILQLLVKTILSDDRRYIDFLEYLSPGEIRRPLEFIARFLYSGHTNIDSLLRAVRRNKELVLGFHEFVTAIMLADREYYEERSSDIVNLFAVDGGADASHFNRVAILARLKRSQSEQSEFGMGFIPMATVIDDCAQLGMGSDTAVGILNLFNQRRLVETETQIREEVEQSEHVRITTAGLYYIETLCHEFSYLDGILADTPIGIQRYFDELREYTLRIEKETKRLRRVGLRLQRTRMFLEYLKVEFDASSFTAASSEFDPVIRDLAENMLTGFDEERKRIFKKAKSVFEGKKKRKSA